MLKRTITSIVIVLVTIPLCFLCGTWVLPAAVSLFTLIGIYEILGCIGVRKYGRITVPACLLAVSVPLICRWIPDTSSALSAVSVLLFFFLFYLTAAGVFSHGELDAERIFSAFSPVFYVIAGFSSLVLLGRRPFGFSFMVVTLYAPWISDVFAYLCGRFFGKHKLIPGVSPKKTVEGTVGGILFTPLFTVVSGVIMNYFIDEMERVSIWSMVLCGVVVSAVSQIGDLIMSYIKRKYGVKDFGTLLPGHGGILDRFDSVLAVAPFMLLLSMLQDYLKFFE